VTLGETPAGAVLVDDTAAYTTWLASHGAAAILIRPDFAIFGSVGDSAGVADLVDDYLTQLGHTALAAFPVAAG